MHPPILILFLEVSGRYSTEVASNSTSWKPGLRKVTLSAVCGLEATSAAL